MSDRAEIPPEVAAAFKRSIQRILDRLKEEPHQAAEPDDRFEFGGQSCDFAAGVVHAYIDNHICLTRCLEIWFNEFNLDDDVDVALRTMSKIEAWFDAFRAISAEVRSWRATGEYAVGRNLLASVFEHTLHEGQSFLERMAEALTDPIATPEKRELATPDSATISSGTMAQDAKESETKNFLFEMTPAPALSELVVWMRRMHRREGRRTGVTGRPRRRRSGFSRKKHERGSFRSSSFLLGGLFGLGLGILGDDD